MWDVSVIGEVRTGFGQGDPRAGDQWKDVGMYVCMDLQDVG
jgi:hypothetical protein